MNLYTNATYTVIQEIVIPTSCSPVPPICSPPVCVDKPSCGTFCSAVTIDCSLSVIDNCTQEIRYSIDGRTPMMPPENLIIRVSRLLTRFLSEFLRNLNNITGATCEVML